LAVNENESATRLRQRRSGSASVTAYDSSCAIVAIEGAIDETFERGQVLAQAGSSECVVFDLNDVYRLSSFGIPEWLEVMTAIPASYYAFIRARPVVISQFNVVMNFPGRGELLSAYAPYICGECGTCTEVLVDIRKTRTLMGNAPCAKCKAEAELDEHPDTYFEYVSRAAPVSPPPEVDEILSGVRLSRTGPFRIQKEVLGNVTAIWMSGVIDKSVRLKRLDEGLEGSIVLELSGIGDVQPEGVMEVGKFLRSTPAETVIARARVGVARALMEIGLGRARAYSVLVPCECEQCSWRGEIESRLPFRWTQGGEGPVCPGCRTAAATPRIAPEVAEALLKTPKPRGASGPRRDVGDEVAAYLQTHPHGPTRVATPVRPRKESRLESAPRLGEYHLVRRLGSGAASDVFLASRRGPGAFEKKVALKKIHTNLADDAIFIDMFLHEAELAARITHSNVVQIFDLGRIDAHYFIAMEYVQGWDLQRVLDRLKKLRWEIPVELACRIMAGVLAGLHAAHGHCNEQGSVVPIVHRDVTPHNILVSNEGEVKLSGFGIARAADVAEIATTTGKMMGRISHMAPERIASGDDVADPRSDIFSAGVVLWEMLAMEPLFERGDRRQTMHALLRDPIPRLSERRADVPQDLDEIISRSLARDPGKRIPSAQAFLRELEDLLRTMPTSSPQHLGEWLREVIRRDVDGKPTTGR
jgi:serine/threonine protein kinase